MTIETREPAAEPVILMRRVFDAPRETVWATLTNPEHVKQWYGGHGFSNPVCEMDVRPGGRWRHVMRTPDGHEFPMEFVFVEVTPPARLVWRNADTPGIPQVGMHAPTITVELEDAGDRTRWTMTARFDSLASRDGARKIGFADVLAQGTEKFNELLTRGA